MVHLLGRDVFSLQASNAFEPFQAQKKRQRPCDRALESSPLLKGSGKALWTIPQTQPHVQPLRTMTP
jgi:hypothetical protein